MDEQENPFAEETGAAQESTATASEADSPFASNSDSTAETDAPQSTDKASQPVAEKEAEGEAVSNDKEAAGEAEEEKTLEELVADADKEIANEKNSAYYRNGLKTYKNAFMQRTKAIEEEYEPLKNFGSAEEVSKNLELVKGLDAVAKNPQTGIPERTVKPFVEKLTESKGLGITRQVFQEIGQMKSDRLNGTLFHEILAANGLDPHRFDELKAFAASGYQLSNTSVDPDELSLIPENLREAYQSLSPQARAKISPYADEDENDAAFRSEFLEREQFKLETERGQKQQETERAAREQAEKTAQTQKFHEDWNARHLEKAEESGGRIQNEFVESLVNQAGLERYEALGQAMLVSAAINGTGAEGAAARAELKAQGLELDAKLGELFKEWDGATNNLAYYELAASGADTLEWAKKVASLESAIAAKVNPVIAHFAQKKGDAKRVAVKERNGLIDSTQHGKTGINSNEGQPHTAGAGKQAKSKDFSDSAFAAMGNPFG